ncbi:hypothetical protein EYF80_061130 [Liparis tanakae]|uniref:Uncharacterized protein n=1 Tax=Liparis tanakae TaxID=230148 RepID=A0A4Z2EK42_9TELE|nr:hypothetical protein EYF80_061130 [Liparis tanakae]
MNGTGHHVRRTCGDRQRRNDSQWQRWFHWSLWGIGVQLSSEDQSVAQLRHRPVPTDTHHPDGQEEAPSSIQSKYNMVWTLKTFLTVANFGWGQIGREQS